MNIATFALLSVVAGVVLAPLLALLAWLIDGLRQRLARRRRVLGSRVRAPGWGTRRLTNGQWIVERRK